MTASLARPAASALPGDRPLTAMLIPQAGAELRLLQQQTGLSRTDLVNRAITLYAFTETQLRDGQDLLLRDTRSARARLIRFA